MMADMHIHTLHFTDAGELSRAFRFVKASVLVEDCLVEPAELRLRFVAPGADATELVERIYLHGGLTWCQRHPLRSDTLDQSAILLARQG